MATCCSCGKSGEAMYFICGECAAQKAATNGDRIRGMSDEELAGLLKPHDRGWKVVLPCKPSMEKKILDVTCGSHAMRKTVENILGMFYEIGSRQPRRRGKMI